MTTNFIKMHGLKNDFVIIDGREKKIHLSKNQIKKIANRKIGLGCDQIIILEKPKNKKTFGFIKSLIQMEVKLKLAVMRLDALLFF